MYILGISGGTRQGNQDGSATLLKDGKIIAFVEEERLFRVKHAAGRLPENAVRFVLKEAGIGIEEVDQLTFPGETYSNFEAVLERYFISKFGCCPPVELVHHHDAHCASAFYASGFSDAMIISYDLSGDGVSTQLAKGQGGEMDVIKRFPKPNSLGIYYSLLTQFMGFTRDSDEYKVMGLSSYGRRGSHDLSKGGRMFCAKIRSRDLPPTCPPLAPMTYFVKGRSDVFGQIPVARLAPHLPPTCPHGVFC